MEWAKGRGVEEKSEGGRGGNVMGEDGVGGGGWREWYPLLIGCGDNQFQPTRFIHLILTNCWKREKNKSNITPSIFSVSGVLPPFGTFCPDQLNGAFSASSPHSVVILFITPNCFTGVSNIFEAERWASRLCILAGGVVCPFHFRRVSSIFKCSTLLFTT